MSFGSLGNEVGTGIIIPTGAGSWESGQGANCSKVLKQVFNRK